MEKFFHPFNMAFFELIGLNIMSDHRRYLRNTERLKRHLQSIIDDRRRSPDDSSDLLTILINSEHYKNDDELMRHDMFVFFFAGMKTIQISTSNMIYYMEKHPEYKEKLLKEILPPVEKVKDNILQGLTYDTVQEFNYL